MKSDRAFVHVLNMHFALENKIFSLCMGIPAAIRRADVIDRTTVIVPEKMTGSFPVYNIAFRIPLQIFFPVSILRHSHVLRNSFYIGFCISRRHGFAAIGALPAVND